MSLIDKVSQEIKSAMLAKEADRLATLRLLKSAIGYAQIERKNENLPDSEVVGLIQKEIKKRRDSIEHFEKGGRPELAAKEKAEVRMLEGFLPQPLTPAELEELVLGTIKETGAASKKDMGPVIKSVQAKAAGRADGKTISSVVGRLLP
jgi:uncharacterized protein YqeY